MNKSLDKLKTFNILGVAFLLVRNQIYLSIRRQ